MYIVLARLRNFVIAGSSFDSLSEIMKWIIQEEYVSPLKNALKSDSLSDEDREILEDKLDVAEEYSSRSEQSWKQRSMSIISKITNKNPTMMDEIASYLVDILLRGDTLKKFVLNDNDALDTSLSGKDMLARWNQAFQQAVRARGKDGINKFLRYRKNEFGLENEDGESLVENIGKADDGMTRSEMKELFKRFFKYLQKKARPKKMKTVDGDVVSVPLESYLIDFFSEELTQGGAKKKIKFKSDIYPGLHEHVLEEHDVDLKYSQGNKLWNDLKEKTQSFFEDELGRSIPIRFAGLEHLGLRLGSEYLAQKMARYVLGFDFIVEPESYKSLTANFSDLRSRR